MTDIYTSRKRSEIMSRISGQNTRPEIIIRNIIDDTGCGYATYKKSLPGRPDLVFAHRKKVVFVNGCFWHGHRGCKRSKLPETNKKFWQDKITANKRRDKSDHIKLRKRGWEYLVVWQCEIKKSNMDNLKAKIDAFLRSK